MRRKGVCEEKGVRTVEVNLNTCINNENKIEFFLKVDMK